MSTKDTVRPNVALPNFARLGGALLLGACSLGPAYHRPSADIPAAFRATPATAATAWPDPAWWRGFRSPTLDELEDSARASNQTIAAAVGRVRQADAQVRIAGAALLPTVSTSAGDLYESVGAGTRASNAGLAGLGGIAGSSAFGSAAFSRKSRVIRAYTVTASASYELDFWGRNRALTDAAIASAVFSRFDQQVVALTVATNVAATWFNALAFEDRTAIAERNLRDAEQVLAVIRARLEVGTASALDVAQEEALVAGQRAALPGLRNQAQQQLIALGILAGVPPERLRLPPGTLNDLPLPEVSPGLPSALLERRPDVAEAEANLVFANANIRAARAAFFPAITLTNSTGYQSNALNTLINPSSLLFSIAANAAQPIFDGGTLRGQLEQARGRQDELVADYRQAILQAFTDTEQALTAYQLTTEQERLQRQAVATAQRAANIARAQLEAGTVDITTVLQAQTTLYNDEDVLAQVRSSRFQALVSLYKALGGGWVQPSGPILDDFPGLSPGRVGGGVALPIGGNVR